MSGEKREPQKKKYRKPSIKTDQVLEALGATCVGRRGQIQNGKNRKHVGSCKVGKS